MPGMRLLDAPRRARSSIEIADAVLQADDDGVGRCVAGDQVCHLGGGTALHRHEDDPRLRQGRLGVSREGDRGCGQCPVGAIEIGDARAVPRDGLGQGRSQQQCHVASGQRETPAHVAADAAGAGNDDA